MEESQQYVLSGHSIAAIGGVLGALTGIISWLLRKLLRSKDEQIEDIKTQAAHTEETLTHDRDYWRDYTMRLLADRGSYREAERR